MRRVSFALLFMFISASVYAATPTEQVKEKIPVPEVEVKKPTTEAQIPSEKQTQPFVGSITGQIQFGDEEVIKGGVVSFFNKKLGPPPDLGTSQRVPERVIKIDPQSGRFGAKLPPGEYYIGAMKWKKGRLPGPPKPDEEVVFLYSDNGTIQSFVVEAGESRDIGVRKGEKRKGAEEIKNVLFISGRVTDENKKPFEGAVVILKHDINSERPAYVSKPTGKDGKYQFHVLEGQYFIVAREGLTMAGRPRPGSYLGAYGQVEELGAGGRQGAVNSAPVSGKTGESLKDIDIAMFKIPSPEEKKVEREKEANAQKIEAAKKVKEAEGTNIQEKDAAKKVIETEQKEKK